MYKLVWFSILVVILTTTDAARILAYMPFPSISHQVVFRPVTQELARRGHEVVVITTDPAFPKGETPANLTEIDIHDITYEAYQNAIFSLTKGDKDDSMDNIEVLFHVLTKNYGKQLKDPGVKDVVFGNRSFDLLILEACSRPALALSHVFKAPVILISSFGPLAPTKEMVGAPTHPFLYATPMRQRLHNLTFWEKLQEFYLHFKLTYKLQRFEAVENEMLQKHFGKDLPPLSELSNNVDMLFLNVHPIFEGNHPVPPSVVYIWGIHKTVKKELPKEIKTFLDSSENGVIYMSFGTNTDPTKLDPDMIQKFVKVFCEQPYDILWKWNADELPGRCQNIRIGKWFPQADLLRHPNIKLFITQGGLQSTDEAIAAEVPLIGIPMLGDQWYNVEKYVKFKIGIHLDATKFTTEDLKSAVTTVINDESYRKNIQKLNILMNDDPLPALERAVWWTEYVLRHKGAKHLRAPAANISWAQYLELEFFLTLLSGLFVIISLIFVVLYSLYRYILQKYFKSTKLKTK